MSFLAGEIFAELTLDRTPFQVGLRQAIKETEDFEGRRFSATLDAEDRPAKRKLGGLYADMRKVARQRATPKVDVDVTGAAALMKIREQVAALPDRKNIEVHVDTERAGSAVGRLGSAFGGLGGAIVPVLASLVAVAPAAIGAGAAVGGIGVAALGVLAPLGLLALGMKQAFKAGGPEIKAFKAAIAGLKKDFAAAVGPGAREAFKGLTSMFKDLRTVLPGLRGDFTGLGKAVGTMFKDFGAQFSSPRFREFFSMLTQSATKAVPLLGRSLRNLLDIFRDIATAAMPLLLKGLKMLADWLGKVAGKTKDHDKLRAMFERGAKSLGQFWRIAKNVGSILASIFGMSGKGGSDFLSLIEHLTKGAAQLVKWLSKLPGGDTIAAIGLGFLIWHKPIGGALKLLKGLYGLMGKIIKRAAQKVLFRVGASAAGEGVAGAAGGAAGQKAAMKGGTAAAETAGGAAGGGFLAKFLGKLKGIGPRLMGLIRGIKLAPAFGALLKGVRVAGPVAAIGASIASTLINVLKGKGLGGKLKALLGEVFKTAGMAVPRLVVWITNKIGSLFGINMPKAMKKAATLVVDAIRKVFGKAKDAGVGLVKAVAGGVASAAKFVVKHAADLAKKAWEAIKKAAGKFADAGKAVIHAVAKGVKGAAKAVWDAVKAVAKKAWEIVKSSAKNFVAGGKLLMTKLWEGIKSIAGKVASVAKDVAKGGWKAIKEIGQAFFDAGKAIIGKLIDGIKSAAGAVKDAVKGVISGARDMLPFSEPKNRSSPLYGLAKAGEATIANFGKGIAVGKNPLQARMVATLRGAATAARDAARVKLALMDRQDSFNAAPAPTRAQREGDVVGRINAARNEVDERGWLVNRPPPGVARVPFADEREAMAERDQLHRAFEREDLEAAANVNIKALIPSDPWTLKQVQRGVARGVKHGRPRKHRTRRKA